MFIDVNVNIYGYVHLSNCFVVVLKKTAVVPIVKSQKETPNILMIPSILWSIFSYLGIIFVKKVFADYCEFGTCDETEYCCGENRCCKKTVDVWYYWAAVLLVVITIMVAACLYMKRIKSKYRPYSKLEQQFDEVTTNT